MKRLLLCLATLSFVATSGAGVSALADPPTPGNPAGNHSEILGVVPAHGEAKPVRGGGGNNLSYHGGSVMHANNTVAIYWVPGGTSSLWDSTYQTVMNGFLTDVAAASGQRSNVYFSDTQYSDGAGAITYSSHFSGAMVATDSYPTTGNCTDSVSSTTVCLTDAQLQAEIAKTVGSPAPSTLYFLFTAPNVGSCYDSSHCAFSYYCAYHSSFNGPLGHYIYANQPYAAASSGCSSGQRPNNSAADATINVASHEHNEAITDPEGTAWFDRQGAENGDKCAWNFGSATGPSGAMYNQTINGGHYYLQQEWSNARSGCVLTGT